MTDIAIVAAVRTPIGSFRGAFALFPPSTSAQRCAACLNAASCPPQRSTNQFSAGAHRLRAEPARARPRCGPACRSTSGGHRQSGVRLRAESGSAGAGDLLRRRRDRYCRRPESMSNAPI